MRLGDIILIPFPFSELTEVKVRPSVVITETSDSYRDLVVCAISSVIKFPLTKNEIQLEPSNQNGLRRPSIVKVDRITTIKREKVIAHLGHLEDLHLNAFKTIFISLLD